jgi:hypothetical protein
VPKQMRHRHKLVICEVAQMKCEYTLAMRSRLLLEQQSSVFLEDMRDG